MNSLNYNLTEYIGITSHIEDNYDVYKEHFIEKSVNLSEKATPISEISQVFIECSILDYAIVPAFNSISVNGYKVSENICVVHGKLNLSIQYIENINHCELSVINTKEYFSTFIMLPDNYISESDLTIKSYVDYAKVTKLTPTKVFLYINNIITIGIY